jgi:Icc-related predicted phosphoesterase/predicted nucleotidyltransferase
MKIIFATDIHDSYGQLEGLLSSTRADLYLLGGDLIYKVFHRYSTAWRYMDIQEMLRGRRLRGETLMDTARRALEEAGPQWILSPAREYVALSQRARRHMLRTYERLEATLRGFPDKRIFAVSGNYDMDLQRTPMAERDLHARCIEVEGLRAAGYGRVEMHTPSVPDHLQLPSSPDAITMDISTLREFRPDILLLHHPPYGHLDRTPGKGHSGATILRDLVDEVRPIVVLSGHFHEDWGAECKDGTFFFNPSNFGRVVGVSRVLPGGYFFEISLDGRSFKEAILRRFIRGRVHDVVEYHLEGGRFYRIIVDESHHLHLQGKKGTPRHIRPLTHLRRIRRFFMNFETQETRNLVAQLEKICKELREMGMEVSFDLLGSANFGMATEGSDLDIVVYLRRRDCRPDPMDVCSIPDPLSVVFEGLKGRNLHVEVCDSLDLDRVEEAILREDLEDGQLQRFVFYRGVCRGVNERPVRRVETLLAERPKLRRELEERLREHIKVMVSSMRHRRSFEKYLQRLKDAGGRASEGVLKEIEKYLKGT